MGRPTRDEADRRRDEFVRLLEAGVRPAEAARRAGVQAERALSLVDDDDGVFAALRGKPAAGDGWLVRNGSAVSVAHERGAVALGRRLD